MRLRIFLGLITTSALLSTSVSAQEAGGVAQQNSVASQHDNGINYNFVELRYVDIENDDNDVDGDGFELGGSYRINQQFYALGSISDLDFDRDIDAEVIELGGGMIFPQGNLDITAEFSFIRAEVEDDSENGWSLSAGGRQIVLPNVEARAYLIHTDVDGSDTYIELGGHYFLQSNISLGLTLDVASDDDKITFGGRYHF